MEPSDETRNVTESTRQAEERESKRSHGADRPPTPSEEAVIDDEAVDPDVRENYEDMAARGASQEGEGRVP